MKSAWKATTQSDEPGFDFGKEGLTEAGKIGLSQFDRVSDLKRQDRLMSIKREVRKYIVSLAIVGSAMAALATVVIATAGSGAVGTIMARAAFTDSVDIKIKLRGEREVIHVAHAQDTVMQQIVIGPGGHTGWHTHPGPAIVLVKSGELTVYSSEDPTCTGHPFGLGQGFVDSGHGHVHIGRNLTNQNTEVWVTYLDVPPGGSPRIDAANPGNCNF